MKTLLLVLSFPFLSASIALAGGNTSAPNGNITNGQVGDKQQITSVNSTIDGRVIVTELPCGLPFSDANGQNYRNTYQSQRK